MNFVMFFIWVVFGLYASRETRRYWRDSHQISFPWLDAFWGISGSVLGGSVFQQMLLSGFRGRIYFIVSSLGAMMGVFLLLIFGWWLSAKTNKDHIFWVKWVIANVGSAVIAIYTVQALQGDSTLITLIAFPSPSYIHLLCIALTLGVAQWSVLQTRIAVSAKKYILATSLSYILASYINSNILILLNAFCDAFVYQISSVFSFCSSNNIFGIFTIGTIIGFVQWLLIRRFFTQTRLVFIANILGWLLVMLLSPLIGLVSFNSSMMMSPLTSIFGVIAIAGLTMGVNSAVTGLALVWLLSRAGNQHSNSPVLNISPNYQNKSAGTSSKKFEKVLFPSLDEQIRELAGIAWSNEKAVLDPDFFLTADEMSSVTSPEQILDIFLSQARRVAPGLLVPHMVPRVFVEPMQQFHAGSFTVDDEGWVKISISPNFMSDNLAAQAILAHETCHYILENAGIRKTDTQDNERYTDLCIFVLGFGEVFLQGYRRKAAQHAYRPGHQLGYLTDAEYEFAQQRVKELRQDFVAAPVSELELLTKRLTQLTQDPDISHSIIEAARKRFPDKSDLELFRFEVDRLEWERRRR
jgi:hypothetical protein